MTATSTLSWEGFAALVRHVLPAAADVEPTTVIARLPVNQRAGVRRLLVDLLDQPTDPAIIRQFATLDDAWRWAAGALAAGERLRSSTLDLAPGLTTRVRLRPLTPADLPVLYAASFDPTTDNRWRHRGTTFPFAEFEAVVFDGVRTQYVVELRATGAAVGLVAAYDHHDAGQHCKAAFLRIGGGPDDEAATYEGLLTFLRVLFETFPYRRVFFEVPAYNLELVAGALGEFVTEVGRLPEYFFHEGRAADLHLLAIDRQQFADLRSRYGPLVGVAVPAGPS